MRVGGVRTGPEPQAAGRPPRRRASRGRWRRPPLAPSRTGRAGGRSRGAPRPRTGGASSRWTVGPRASSSDAGSRCAPRRRGSCARKTPPASTTSTSRRARCSRRMIARPSSTISSAMPVEDRARDRVAAAGRLEDDGRQLAQPVVVEPSELDRVGHIERPGETEVRRAPSARASSAARGRRARGPRRPARPCRGRGHRPSRPRCRRSAARRARPPVGRDARGVDARAADDDDAPAPLGAGPERREGIVARRACRVASPVAASAAVSRRTSPRRVGAGQRVGRRRRPRRRRPEPGPRPRVRDERDEPFHPGGQPDLLVRDRRPADRREQSAVRGRRARGPSWSCRRRPPRTAAVGRPRPLTPSPVRPGPRRGGRSGRRSHRPRAAVRGSRGSASRVGAATRGAGSRSRRRGRACPRRRRPR